MARSKPAPEPERSWPADKVERRPLDQLIGYARNARTHSPAQIAQIKASMVEFGWTIPVLVDPKGVLIAGHGRVEAAAELGFASAPTMVAHGWSAAQVQAYRLVDNKMALNADWDPELLRIEVGDLKDQGYNVELLAFGTDELEKLFAIAEPPNEFPEFDETIETEHICPQCGYQWSGGKVTTSRSETEAK